MKRIVIGILGTLGAVVLLFSYKTSLDPVSASAAPAAGGSTPSAPTPSASTAPSPSAAPPTSNTPSGSGATAGSGAAAPAPTTGASATGLADGTFTGQPADTRYGAVQVAITVSGGRITDVQVPQSPSQNRRDTQINGQALPVLVSETTDAQSANIQMVSGATYTSDGYVQSLQSALDQAGAK